METHHSTLIDRQNVSSCIKFNERYAVNNPTELLDALNREIFEVSEMVLTVQQHVLSPIFYVGQYGVTRLICQNKNFTALILLTCSKNNVHLYTAVFV